MQQTIAQFLKIKDFPFIIKNKNGKRIYFESSTGFWTKREYNSDGNEIYFEDSNGFWVKTEYNSDGNEIYYENSNGFFIDNRPKVVVEMTLQEVASKLGMDVKSIRIKD
jgi:hypothetical protein